MTNITLTDRHRWGNWQLKKYNWTLVYNLDFERYEIDLEKINTCGAMLDFIFQLVGGKTWMTVQDGTDLIEAFRAIYDPQANLCSFHSNKTIDAPRFLRERFKEEVVQ